MIDLEYTEVDGLLYPNIQLDDAELYDDLGKYGNLRLKFLHEQKPQRYRELLFTGKLARHCAEIEQTAFDMAERVRGQYLNQHPAPAEGMERIQAFEQAQMIADELVLHDIVYSLNTALLTFYGRQGGTLYTGIVKSRVVCTL